MKDGYEGGVDGTTVLHISEVWMDTNVLHSKVDHMEVLRTNGSPVQTTWASLTPGKVHGLIPMA